MVSFSAFIGFLAVTWAALLVAVVSAYCLFVALFRSFGEGATVLDKIAWWTGQGLVLLALVLMSGALAGGLALALVKAFGS